MTKGFGLDFVQTPEVVRRYSFRVVPVSVISTLSDEQTVRILAADTSVNDRFFVLSIFSVRNVLGTKNAIYAGNVVGAQWALNPLFSSFISGGTNNPGNQAAVLAYRAGVFTSVDIPLAYAFSGGVDIDLRLNLSTSSYVASALVAGPQWEALIALII